MLIAFAYPTGTDHLEMRGTIDSLVTSLREGGFSTTFVKAQSAVPQADLLVVFAPQADEMSDMIGQAISQGSFVAMMNSGPSSVKRKGRIFGVSYAGYFDALRCIYKVIWFLERK